jgi:hypothetical protein
MRPASETLHNIGLGIVLGTDAIWRGLLHPVYLFPPGDFEPAEAHRNPSGDQLQHKVAGVTTIVRQVIGKRDASAPRFCHDPHFNWRCACQKVVPEHRQPVSWLGAWHFATNAETPLAKEMRFKVIAAGFTATQQPQLSFHRLMPAPGVTARP